jgi:hypothetical protein
VSESTASALAFSWPTAFRLPLRSLIDSTSEEAQI